ncbi:MAG: hypothetical protein IRD7MM_00240 [Candidatus Midichloria mitochondrii]|uniref:hypothetical protein n=1 Tax=Candidatus Midichloria mitochondrii TaxID=234827 RepID=UPI00031C58D6|nr:hypothetical protein [Candidatus Midichloria mitochondrii]MDJ1256664.1 hypothetical protein [Candidatus Midichloria mitochondrii]MDJ1288386.1 hypothetical protein [Candidatus Midichloria mitochondrii]MDJ1299225.1 hypothetical protein [Candidatus Midichloria mitochondrii]MDJ1313351.1 hypothetical protein [Candidatus Midichloria mitochondrii]MDJ1583908.1 hypothetical protein [Candidatus Midichloria mitochondrii]
MKKALDSKYGRILLKSCNKLELGKFHKAVELIVEEDKSGLGQLFKGNDTPQCDSKYSNFNLLQLGFMNFIPFL